MLQGLNTSLSALNANQRALDVTSHNISNFSTEGYTKQRANFTDNPIKDTPNAGMNIRMGTGTHIQSVERIEDKFLYEQLNNVKKEFSRNSVQMRSLEAVDEQAQTFTDLYDMFFESLNRYVEMPHNIELQHLSEQQAKSLTEKSEQLQEVFNNQRAKNQQQIEQLTKEQEPLQVQINELDLKIKEYEALNEHMTDKTYANSLRDRKDLLTTQYEMSVSKVEGYEKSNEALVNIQNTFKSGFDESYQNIQTYLDSSQSGDDALQLQEFEDKIRGRFNEPFVALKDMKGTMGIMSGSSEYIMTALQNKDDNISKVNLNEEMVNMVKYQSAYQANAKVIQTYDEILQTTIDLKR